MATQARLTISSPQVIRAIAKDPAFVNSEWFKAEANGHKFKSGDTAILTGLADFPEFNGTTVKITAIREDGPRGRAYYIAGKIDEMLNWVYEYRLESIK